MTCKESIIENLEECKERKALYRYNGETCEFNDYEQNGDKISVYLESGDGGLYELDFIDWVELEEIDPEERFDETVGAHLDPAWLCDLSDEELAAEIRKSESWDADLLRELCYRGDTLREFIKANDCDCPAIYTAAEKLGVEII